jgi:hypothetical protein
MIVSASYRTDIPAFYGRWFMRRLDAGFCRVTNPYGGPAFEVPLAREAVDGFVFWTRNAGAFMGPLHEVRRRGYPFTVQFTLTGYPKALESSVIEAARAIEQVRALAAAFGPKTVVWRYDPISATTLTPLEWHAENFARLASALEGATDEVVVSFVQVYRKTRRNLDAAARAHRFAWSEPAEAAKRALVSALIPIAARHGMTLALCTQPQYRVDGARDARCIDAARLSAVAGHPIAARTRGNRAGCLCAESRDIGAYDSCPHGCVYCYAVGARAAARRRHRTHDAESEYLIAPERRGARAGSGGRVEPLA